MRAAVVIRAHAYPVLWRIIVAVLLAVSGASLPATLVAVVFASDPPITPFVLIRLVLVFALLPWLVAWLIQRALAVHVEVGGAQLVLRRRGLLVEIPCGSIERIVPWKLPLPGPGLWLSMRSGRRLGYGIQIADPTPLLSALSDLAGLASAREAVQHSSVVYARVKRSVAAMRWYHLVGKFVVFALAPALVLFNTHQHIAYGGPLGEYHMYGLAAYLRTFGVYWVTLSIYLVLYASVWRGLSEGVALLTAWVAPAGAVAVRRAAEIACRALYYGGVPVLLVLRYLA